MPDCLFSIYYENGKECDRQYKCDGCEAHKSIKVLVGVVMEQKAKNKKLKIDGSKCVLDGNCLIQTEGGGCGRCIATDRPTT